MQMMISCDPFDLLSLLFECVDKILDNLFSVVCENAFRMKLHGLQVSPFLMPNAHNRTIACPRCHLQLFWT